MREATADCVIEEPEFRPYVKSATDIARVGIGLLLILSGLLLGWMLRSVDSDLTASMADSFLALPRWLSRFIIDGIAVTVSVTVVAVIVVVLVRRNPRFLLVAILSQAIAAVLVALLEPPLVPLDAASSRTLAEIDQLLTGGGVPSPASVASLAVLASLAAPWLGRRWSHWLWTLLTAYSLVWAIGTPESPGSVIIAVGAGVAGAGVASQLLGRPNLRPRGRDIADAYARSGLPLSSLSAASVDARGSTPYFATTVDGREVFIKVLAEDERSSDLLFRAYRGIRFKNLGDFRPFSSLRRAVEHEALVSLWASANGVLTPPVASVATVGANGISLAYERIDGRSLDGVDAEELDQPALESAWKLIAQLREHGIAHRDLRLANVFLDDTGTMWLIDFGFSELAATDEQLRSDVAEFLASTAVKVGVERAVAACVAVLGTEALADAAPRLQPMALSTATRKGLKDAGLTDSLHQEVVGATGVDRIDFEKLERVRLSTIVVFLFLGLALYLLAPQLAGFKTVWSQVGDIRWSQVWPALAASGLTYVAAAVTLVGAVPIAVPLGLTILAQLAGSFVNRVVPGRVGGMATNVLFLQKQGVETPMAIGGVGVQTVMGVITHIAMTVVFAFVVGNSGASEVLKRDIRMIVVTVAGVALLTGLLMLIPWLRRKAAEKVLPTVKRSLEGLRSVAHQPRKLAQLVGGATLLNIFYISALVLSVRAFGGDASFASIGLAYLLGAAIASAAPTPGGIGAVEAALTAGLVAVGVPKEIALPSVLLFRIVTFWLPVLPGWVSLLYLQRRDAL